MEIRTESQAGKDPGDRSQGETLLIGLFLMTCSASVLYSTGTPVMWDFPPHAVNTTYTSAQGYHHPQWAVLYPTIIN